ncbi:MAG: M1 family aminopeptidase [Thermoanaerobaculia bacterium]
MKSTRLAAFAALLFVCTSAQAARFNELLKNYRDLKLGATSSVSQTTYAVGHMNVTLESGTSARVMAGNDVAGIFFKGDGTFVYQSVDAIEAPVVAFNVKRQSHLASKVDAGTTTLTGTFTEMLVLVAGAALPETGATTGAVAPGSPLEADFVSHRDLFAQENASSTHLLMQQRLAFPAAKVARLEFRGGRDELVYTFDGAESHDETLYTLHRPQFADSRIRKILFPAVLSRQPIDRDPRVTQSPAFYLTAIDYVLTADGDNANLVITESISRQNPQQGVLRFEMDDVAFTEASTRRYHVASVTDEKGNAVPFDHEAGDLLVGVEGFTGDSLTLRFTIDGNFLIRWSGDNAWQLGTHAWFPQPALGGQFYTIHSVVKVKKPFIAFAPGDTIKRSEQGDDNVVENSVTEPVQFAVVHAGKYNVYEQTKGDLTIRVASYAGRNDRAGKQLSDLAFSIVAYYQYFLGPFPWKEFNIVQVNTFGYGQAPPATMFITNEAFNSIMGEENQFFSEGINERFAHEIAHQYWGHVVKMPSSEEQWLTESFAEYSAALVLRKYQGEAVYNRLVRKWKADAKLGTSVAPIALANLIEDSDPVEGFRLRFDLLYAKGPYLLSVLHKEMGDQMFLTFMKSYQKSFRWKFGSTNGVAGLLQFITKKDYQPFFEKYYWGTAMPD